MGLYEDLEKLNNSIIKEIPDLPDVAGMIKNLLEKHKFCKNCFHIKTYLGKHENIPPLYNPKYRKK